MIKDRGSEDRKGPESTHQVLMLKQHYVMFMSWEPGSRIGKDEWIADSGASTHLATKREMFRDYNPIPGIVEGIDETNST